MNIKEDFTRQAEAQLARLDMLEGGPTELHKLVSARGLITPPESRDQVPRALPVP